MIFIVGILALCLCVWFLLKWQWIKRYWSQRKVHYENPHPLWGSLTFMLKENAGRWMIQLYKKASSLNVPYTGIWLFWRPALVVHRPDLARRIMVKDAEYFRDRFLTAGNSDPMGNLNLFMVKDPIWNTVRRQLTPVFTSAKLRALEPLLLSKSKELVQRIENDLTNKRDINLRDTYSDYTTDVISTSAFGITTHATLTSKDPLRTITKDFQDYSFLRGIAVSCIFFWPELVDYFKFKFFPESATNYLRKIFKAMVKHRGGYEAPVSEDRDLLDFLINLKRKAHRDNKELSEDLLVAQGAIMIQGGFDTSGSALTFLTYELAHHPEIQEKLYQEIIETKAKIKGDFDTTTLADMVYLNCAINEALRKYPPMGWFDRVAKYSYHIDENLTIPAGMPVYVNGIGMQWDPEFFPEPEKFIPERFLPENEGNIKPYTYMPFGEGPRNCIGKRFGLNTVRFALVHIMQNYMFRPIPDCKPPNECEWERKGLFLLPGEPMFVKFVPRDN